MKKIVSLMLIFMIIISMVSVSFAESVLGEDEEEIISGDDYQNAQNDDKKEDDTDKETSKDNSTLPQTGVENFGLGILLIVCAGSAIFAYKKVSDYKGI